MQGIYRSDDKWLHNIENGKCCKPPGHPDSWGECYENDVTGSWDNAGWADCRAGFYLVGFYRGQGDRLYCIEKFKCCKMADRRT